MCDAQILDGRQEKIVMEFRDDVVWNGERAGHHNIPELAKGMIKRKDSKPAFVFLGRDGGLGTEIGFHEDALRYIGNNVMVGNADAFGMTGCSVSLVIFSTFMRRKVVMQYPDE